VGGRPRRSRRRMVKALLSILKSSLKGITRRAVDEDCSEWEMMRRIVPTAMSRPSSKAAFLPLEFSPLH